MEGGLFGLRARSVWITRQAHLSTHPQLTFNSPVLRVGADKSGVEGGEWKVSSMQIHVLLRVKRTEKCGELTFHSPTSIHPELG